MAKNKLNSSGNRIVAFFFFSFPFTSSKKHETNSKNLPCLLIYISKYWGTEVISKIKSLHPARYFLNPQLLVFVFFLRLFQRDTEMKTEQNRKRFNYKSKRKKCLWLSAIFVIKFNLLNTFFLIVSYSFICS